MVLNKLLYEKALRSTILTKNNKETYRQKVITLNNSLSFDISTCKIWYVLVVLSKDNCMEALCVLDQLFSCIPKFALRSKSTDSEATQSYVDMFIHSTMPTMQRARKAWLLDITFPKHKQEILPLAFSIELNFCDSVINLIIVRPYICLYYLKFLCHHMLRQYGERDSTLRQLVDYVSNSDQCERDVLTLHHSYNITGHCLLMVGKPAEARDMFTRSYQYTETKPPWNKYNSAQWYIQNFC